MQKVSSGWASIVAIRSAITAPLLSVHPAAAGSGRRCSCGVLQHPFFGFAGMAKIFLRHVAVELGLLGVVHGREVIGVGVVGVGLHPVVGGEQRVGVHQASIQ